jgi:hypothetical protein
MAIRTNKPTDAEVQGIVARVLSNQDEVKDFLTKWLQRNIGIVQRKSKSYNERRLTMNLLLPLTENKSVVKSNVIKSKLKNGKQFR